MTILRIVVTTLATVPATVLLHAAGTTWWLQRLRSRPREEGQVVNRWALLSVLVKTALLLIALHVAEVFVWAVAFRLIPGSGLTSLEESMYFSFTTFTTLGYGDITLEPPWRLLTGIESLNGLILIGWSTALTFAVIQHAWKEPSQR